MVRVCGVELFAGVIVAPMTSCTGEPKTVELYRILTLVNEHTRAYLVIDGAPCLIAENASERLV